MLFFFFKGFPFSHYPEFFNPLLQALFLYFLHLFVKPIIFLLSFDGKAYNLQTHLLSLVNSTTITIE